MEHRTVVVVGDKFSEFGALDGAITVSKLANMIDGLIPESEMPRHVIFGQGISESWLNYLKNRVATHSLPIQFSGERQISERTGRRFCHKWQRRNVLITDPQHVGPKNYRMLLSVDDDCEIMSDHVSGHHLQGMVLIEAARQAFLAVTERFLLPDTGKYYFAINKFDVTYLKFVFPLPTEIHFELLEADDSRSERLSASAKIAFYQAGERVCEVDVSYMAIVETILSAKEKKLAQGILSQIRSNAMRQSAEGALVA